MGFGAACRVAMRCARNIEGECFSLSQSNIYTIPTQTLPLKGRAF